MSRETVLLVDDEPMIRDCLANYITSFGYSVVVASDGVEALTKAQRHDGEICLLISDIKMPRMDGLQLACLFHEERPAARILLISGFTNECLGQEAHFLAKPFTKDELRKKIEAILGAEANAASR